MLSLAFEDDAKMQSYLRKSYSFGRSPDSSIRAGRGRDLRVMESVSEKLAATEKESGCSRLTMFYLVCVR